MGHEWDEHAADWDSDPGPRAYADAAFASLMPLLDRYEIALDGAHVLDFGCGTGLLTERLVGHGAVVDALDTSPAMLDVLRGKVERNGWSTVRTISDPTEAGGPYDLVVCSSVLSFVDDHPGTVDRLVSSLRPAGVFVQWDWERDDTDPDDHGLTVEEIRVTLVNAGLGDVAVGPAFELQVDGEQMRPLLGHGSRLRSGD